MLITKGCPRCHGDLVHVSDVGDSYYSCVQCGHVAYEGTPAFAAVQWSLVDEKQPSLVSRDEVARRRMRRQIATSRKVA